MAGVSLRHLCIITKRRRSQLLRLLPAAGVLPGVSGFNWAEVWLKNRKEHGLAASLTCPTMPAPLKNGGWTKLPLTSSEAAVWIREILNPWTTLDMKDYATHSAKATVLSWMSKANVPISLRRLAGYHSKPGDRSALEYSRDAQAPVLHQIEAIYLAIKSGRFCPDAPRSQRWVGCRSLQTAMEQAASCVIEPTVVDSGLEHEEVSDETEAEAPDVDMDSVREKVSEIFQLCPFSPETTDLGWQYNIEGTCPAGFSCSWADQSSWVKWFIRRHWYFQLQLWFRQLFRLRWQKGANRWRCQFAKPGGALRSC